MNALEGLAGPGWSWVGAGLGLVFAVGWVLLLTGLPLIRQTNLEDRLEPYLRDTPRPSRLLAAGRPHGVPGLHVSAVFRPLLAELAAGVERMLGGSSSVRRRLQRAGQPPDVERFRAEQVLWGAAAGVVGIGIGVLAVAARNAPAFPVAVMVVCFVGAGIIARDQWLSHAADQRERRMLVEFPTVAELLALAVSAGEGATAALDRVCRLSHGDLSAELAACLADARAGANLPTALQGLADRTGLVSLARFVDGIVVAVERGTPLAEVMRAQAQDVREAGRRAVMEAGGKKEIAMMVPVVFLVLPVTVLFAIYPGFSFLRFSI